MKRTFKERAVFLAARITNKSKLFMPVVFPVLGVVLGIYNLGLYLFANGKRVISIGMFLLFFFMSSSFANPKDVMDTEVYLSSGSNMTIYDDDVSLVSLDESSDSISKEIEDKLNLELSNINAEIDKEGIDLMEAFTLDDFYLDYGLKDIEESSELSYFDKSSWNLLLVNKTHPLPEGYEVPLASIKGSMKCDERVVDSLYDMLNASLNDGINLIVCSPYREDQLQEKLFLRKINAYMSYGYSYLEAYKISSQDVIVPGTSEHQLGLAFDIVTDYHMVLDYAFGETDGGKWLRNHCAEYGFILRYPKGKENVTGIDYEPWHFRYVGRDAARYIMDNELTLEEFLEDI